MNNPIVKRIYYALDISLDSPLNIFGKSEETDSDLLRNGNGEVFIPGSSIAGALRDYAGEKKNEMGIYGYSDGESGRMSSVFISDLILQDPVIESRDNVKLKDDRTAEDGAKFDMQIAAAGAHGILYLSCVIRRNDHFDAEKTISDAIHAIASGEIRFGAKKTRGFGRLKLNRIYEKTFEAADVNEWIAFEKNEKDLNSYGDGTEFEEWKKEHQEPEARYLDISVPLNLTGGISIRRYSAKAGAADFEHIHSAGIPVIPGSSWSGAIRHDAREILHQIVMEMNVDTSVEEEFINHWFGFVEDEAAQQSRIVISESVLQNSRSFLNVRNRIDRFDNSTEDGALFQENVSALGDTVLHIMIKKEKEYEAAAGLIGLVIEDLGKGYLSVGGGAAIGRGIFSMSKNTELPDGKALYAYLEARKEEHA